MAFGIGSKNADPSRVLQLAYSQMEKAKALSDECARARQAGRIDERRYKTLQEFYLRHIRRAQEKVDFLRQEHRQRADALRKELQDTARRQAELDEKVQAGEMSATRAGRVNEELMGRIAELRERFLVEDRLANVESAADVGGIVDMPLEAYTNPATIEGLGQLSVDRLAGTAVPVLAALAVFLPWRALDGVEVTLAGACAMLQEKVNLSSMGMARWLVVGAVVLPLVGAACVWLEHRRRAGVGLMLVGALMMLLTVGVMGGTGGLLDISGYRSGSIGYILAGVVLVGMGAATRRSAASVPWSKRRGLVALAAAVAAIGVAVWFLLGMSAAGPGLRIAFDPFNYETRTLGISLVNGSGQPVSFYAPWPQGSPGGPLVDNPRSSFGANVYIREVETSTYRLFPESHECWRYSTWRTASASPLELAPNAVGRLEFDLSRIDALDIRPSSVRLVFTNSRGTVLAETELPVSQDRPSS